MGEKIGSGAHLSEICRTAVGEFSLQQAWKLDDLAEAARAGKFKECLIRSKSSARISRRRKRVAGYPGDSAPSRRASLNIVVSQIKPGAARKIAWFGQMELDAGEPRHPRLAFRSPEKTDRQSPKQSFRAAYQPIVVFEPPALICLARCTLLF